MNLLERVKQGQSFLVADDGQFLGKLTLNQYDLESITNIYGNYGSQYSLISIKNQYSQYGSPYSSLSPYNQYSSTPPTIYIKGRMHGYLTKNKFKLGTIVDPDSLNELMREYNLNY
jgi:hypothetical protein